MTKLDTAIRGALAGLQGVLGEMPRNDHAWSYVIRSFGGDPYITRTLLPRALDHRVMVHRLHRPDRDRYMHNHPWQSARFIIASGGYVEERLVGGEVRTTTLRPGDVNRLDANTFHRVIHVEPNTFTIGLVGPRVQDWGFLVDGVLVPWRDYFAQNLHEQPERVPS